MSTVKSMASLRADSWAVCSSRREVLSLMLGSWPFLSGVQAAEPVSAPLRLAISESLMGAVVNANDAKAALLVWIKRITEELNLPIEYDRNVFEPTTRILDKIRAGQVDAVALNTIEYRPVERFLDSSELIVSRDGSQAQYVLLVKKETGFQKLSDLRGRRLIVMNSPKMCLAPAWLSTILFEARLGQPAQVFSSMTSESTPSRVVLPVFFGRAEACITTVHTFTAMSELNPQIGKQLTALATSSELVASFHIFLKGYESPLRERFKNALAGVPRSISGRQLMTLFQFDNLIVRKGDCLKSALDVLEMADRADGKPGAGKPKDRG